MAPYSSSPSQRAQQGVSMLFALMALVVLALAAAGLVRSVDTNALVLGNLGFKQDATTSSAKAAEYAIARLQEDPALLNANAEALGYYAAAIDKLDPSGNRNDASYAIVDWDGRCLGRSAAQYTQCLKPASMPDPGDGNQYQFVISRLCAAAGTPGSTVCTRPASSSTSTSGGHGAISGKEPDPPGPTTFASPYYRIVVRAQSGRNTVSYTETIIHF